MTDWLVARSVSILWEEDDGDFGVSCLIRDWGLDVGGVKSPVIKFVVATSSDTGYSHSAPKMNNLLPWKIFPFIVSAGSQASSNTIEWEG